MHNHPWAVALLALTQIYRDVVTDIESREPFEIEGVHPNDIVKVIDALEQICDVSYR
jgi:hypothetical protein